MAQSTHSGGVWAPGQLGESELHPPWPTRRLRRRKPLPPQLVSSTPFATAATTSSRPHHQRGCNDAEDGSAWSISPAALAESSGGSGGSTGRLSRSSKRRSTALYYWGEAGSSMKVQVRAATKQLCKKSLSTDGTPTDDELAKKTEKKRRKLKHSSSRAGEEEMITKKKTKTKKGKKAKKDEDRARGKESGTEEETSRMSSKKEKKKEKKEKKEKKKRDKEGKKEAKEKKKEKKGTREARAASEGSESGISSCSSAVSPKETSTKKKKKKKKSKSLISAKKVLKSRSPSDPLPPADGKARSFILNFHNHHHRQHNRAPLPPAPSSGPTRSRSATEAIEHRATRKSSIVGLLRRTATADDGDSEPAAASPFFIEEDSCGGLPVADDESGARVAIPLLTLDALSGSMGPSSSEGPDSATSLPPSPSLTSPGGSLASVVATAATKTKSKRVKAWCKKKGLVDKARRRSGGAGLEQYQQLVMTMGALDGDAGSSTPLRHVIVEGRYAVGLP